MPDYRPLTRNYAYSPALRLFICGLLMLLLGASLFGQKRLTKEDRPDWIDNPPHNVFIGVSNRYPDEAVARSEAVNNAKRQIIEALGVQIESEFVEQLIESSGEISSSDAFTESKLKVISKSIIAVKPDKFFIEEWRDTYDGRKTTLYAAFVAVPFSEIAHKALMKDLIAETYTIGKKNYDDAQALALKGLVFMALDMLKTAGENISPVSDLAGMSPLDLADINLLKEDVNATLHQIRNGIRVEGRGGDQAAKLGASLKTPLQVKVFWQRGKEQVGLPNLKVDFTLKTGKATITPFAHTDRNGTAACEVREIACAGKVEVDAVVHFPEGYDFPDQKYTFTLFPNNRVIVKVVEANLGQRVETSYLENTLLQKLSTKGFTAVANDVFSVLTSDELENSRPEQIASLIAESGADLVLLGTVTSGQTNKITDGFFFARCRGTLRVINIQKNAVVGNYILEDKDAGNSEENAGSKSITKVSNLLIDKFINEIGL